MKKNKTLWCILVTIILFSLLFSLVSYRSDANTVLTYSVDSEKFAKLQKSGYSESVDEKTGIITYTSTNNDPWTHIPMQEKISVDMLLIKFDKPIPHDTEIVIYYTQDGGAFDAVHAYANTYALDYSGTLATVFVQNMECHSIRLDMNNSFAINSISFYDVQNHTTPHYSFNYLILILLIVVVATLALLEKRIKYFQWIKDIALEEYENYKNMLEERKITTLIVHSFMRICSLLLLVALGSVLITSKMSSEKIITIFALCCATILLTIADKLLARNYTSPARMFFVTSLLLGIMFVFCLPLTTFNVPDEEIHYALVTDLKNYLFGGYTSLADLKMGWRYYQNSSFITNPLLEMENLAYDAGILFKIETTDIDIYNRINCLPVALIRVFSELFSLSFVQTFIFSKLSNLLIYSFIISMAIRRLKSGGYLFSTICLFPSFITLACSFSYDAWVITFTTFSIVYFISELQRPEKKLDFHDCLFIFGAMFVGCGPKAVYFILMLPFLFVSKNKFRNTKNRKLYISSCIVTMLLIFFSFALPFLMNTTGSSDLRGGSDVNSSEQLAFILNNPFKYADIVFKFLSDYLSFGTMSDKITYHVYLGKPLTVYSTILIFILMFVTFTDRTESDVFEKRHIIKSTGVLGCVGALMLVITALYISFTPVANPTINGLQFRYMFPIMPLFLYCIGPSRVYSYVDKRIYEFIVYGATSIVAFFTLYEYYISKIILTIGGGA